MLNWYALNSKPYKEAFVQTYLSARGIETYLPVWRVRQRRGLGTSPRPYFPSYLFAYADLETVGLSTLQYTPGVRRVVFRGDQPATVGQQVIDELRRRLADLEDKPKDLLGHVLAPGDRVVITRGPFEGYAAIFDKQLSDGERVRVLINFLQNYTPCEMNAEFVEKRKVESLTQLRQKRVSVIRAK